MISVVMLHSIYCIIYKKCILNFEGNFSLFEIILFETNYNLYLSKTEHFSGLRLLCADVKAPPIIYKIYESQNITKKIYKKLFFK